jgi:hypothetical protein
MAVHTPSHLFNSGRLAGGSLQLPIITTMPTSLQTRRHPSPLYLGRTTHLFPRLRTTLSAPITPRQGPRRLDSPWNILGRHGNETEAGFPESPTLFIQRHRLGAAALGDAWIEPSPEVETRFLGPDHSIMEYNHRLKTMQPWYW